MGDAPLGEIAPQGAMSGGEAGGSLTTFPERGPRIKGEAFGLVDTKNNEGTCSAFETRVLEEMEYAKVILSSVCGLGEAITEHAKDGKDGFASSSHL